MHFIINFPQKLAKCSEMSDFLQVKCQNPYHRVYYGKQLSSVKQWHGDRHDCTQLGFPLGTLDIYTQDGFPLLT